MARVKRGVTTHRRHKKILKQAKGYKQARSKKFTVANQAVMKGLMFSYIHRKRKKRDFRRLWITRINAGARMNDISYSKFINGLKVAGIGINRKVLSDLAINDPKAFTELVLLAKNA